ncbi:MAG: Gx transporter family protein [Zetaproteobacteria bacterium]|nr:MAG: Gx transporter family protein [Zetaproteobacteria bacterium]
MNIARPDRVRLIRDIQWLALLLLATAMHVIEAAMPSLGPWFKPGLANIITLITLLLFGGKAAFLLATARIVLGNLMVGTLLTPTFVMSLAGGVSAAFMMIAAWRCLSARHVISISLIGAVTHMSVQFAVVAQLFIQQPHIYFMLPPLLLLALATGWINGGIARYIATRIRHDHAASL